VRAVAPTARRRQHARVDPSDGETQLPLLAPPPRLTRPEALSRLGTLVGVDLRPLADRYGVTVWRDGRRNKGWAGLVVERYLGLPPNATQAPDFGDWELKVVPLQATADGRLRLKETMGVTMLTAPDLEAREFEQSHLLAKLRRILVVARIYEGPEEARSVVLAASGFDLDDPDLLAAVRADYEEARWVVRTQGTWALRGQVGRLVQPRPKGAGHGTGGMGFYARKAFVARMLGLDV
jgi:DNA mismatch repair protein MutH